jgi:hypothetical protein
MNLTAIANKAAKIAFDIAGDALEKVTLHVGQQQTTDFHTGTVTGTGGQDIPTEGVFYRTVQQQQLGVTNVGTFMIKGSAVPDGIDEADTLTFTAGPRNGQVWQIESVETIPTAAVVLLNLRL